MAENPALPEGFVVYGQMAGRAGLATITAVVSSSPEVVVVSGDREDLIQAIRDLRRQGPLAAVPVVVLGGQNAPACYAAGADECVAALGELEVARVLARAARMRALWAESETDVLTGCYMRRFLDSYGQSFGGRSVSILMADLDHFKRVNDTYGHLAGDAVLGQFGLFLRESVRRTDLVVRWGGEEFVVVFTPAGDAFERAAGLCRQWAAKRLRLPQGQTIRSTFSGGLATGGSLIELIAGADEALYRAKKGGRNRVEPADRREQWPGALLDRIYSLSGAYCLVAALRAGSGGTYRVEDARGPFAGQLVGEEIGLGAAEGWSVHQPDRTGHWLFRLAAETLAGPTGRGTALLVGKKGRFKTAEIERIKRQTERRPLET